MTRKQAIKVLTETRELSTKMLKPLGIPFDHFLQFAQLPDDQAKHAISRLVEKLTAQ